MLPVEFHAFAQALCDPNAALPMSLCARTGSSIDDRFAVYRNNVHVSLVEALAERFPIVRALVGEDFFRAMARAYVQEHKPGSEMLHEYGEGLPEFVATFPPAQQLPYLADVARMEAAWSGSWAAQDAAALQMEALSGIRAEDLAEARVRLHPATRLIQSAWPVGSIWQAHQYATPDLASVQWRAECVLITRPEASIHLQQLLDGAAAFTAALLQRQTIADAAAAGFAVSPQLDIGTQLGALIECGALLEIITA